MLGVTFPDVASPSDADKSLRYTIDRTTLPRRPMPYFRLLDVAIWNKARNYVGWIPNPSAYDMVEYTATGAQDGDDPGLYGFGVRRGN